MPLTPGSRLGPYEIVQPIGAGGMGEVYRARDERLGRDVALKILPAEVAASPDRLARFQREARTVAALNHPGIVTLHTIEESGGTHFLTMELVEGDSLDRLVVPGGLPVPRVLELAIPLAEALAAAHERGVVHRDLKPANVMVTSAGRIKVLDFGLAKASAADGSALDLTQAATMPTPISTMGQVVGTVPYMSPEQVRGEGSDARSDLFALGIVLYELLAGRRPFTGANTADLSSAILRDEPPSLAAARPDLPSDLARVIERCLEKSPRSRWQTALDVHNELKRVKRTLDGGASTSSAVAADAAKETPSIAVLPFVNRSRDEEDEYFADGLADELLAVLAKIKGLRVASRTSTFQFKGKNEDLAVIGKKLNVATALEGTVRKSGSRVRISVQLVKIADGYHLWSETYDRTLEDIFAVQDDIARSVVKELRAALLGDEPDSKTSGEVQAEVARAVRGRGTDPEAHRLYLLGLFLHNRYVIDDFPRAVEVLKQAVGIDPDYALAWAMLSRSYAASAAWGETPTRVGFEAARAAALRALAIEPDLVDGHVALGYVQAWYDWDWRAGEASFRRAIELSPGSSEAWTLLGFVEHIQGRIDSAIAHCRRALELGPLDVLAFGSLVRVYRAAGMREEGRQTLARMAEISPDAAMVRFAQGRLYLDEGRYEDAMVEFAREIHDWARDTGMAIACHGAGRHDESEAALQRLITKHADTAAYQVAMVYAARHDADATFEWLERAYAQRDSGLPQVRPEPSLEWLHGDPRWGAFMTKMGLAD
jgi:serine/threonine protein kinase/tetratricopeptide (TPR) repeat protein